MRMSKIKIGKPWLLEVKMMAIVYFSRQAVYVTNIDV